MAMMPPPGMKKKPAVTIAVGIGKPKGMPPPGSLKDEPPAPDEVPAEGGEKKVSAEDALVVRADKHCDSCANYDAASGDCAKVDGYFDPSDACLRYYEPVSDDEGAEDPAEEAGETPAEEAAEMPR
jgi:hypothetical protein